MVAFFLEKVWLFNNVDASVDIESFTNLGRTFDEDALDDFSELHSCWTNYSSVGFNSFEKLNYTQLLAKKQCLNNRLDSLLYEGLCSTLKLEKMFIFIGTLHSQMRF